MRPEDRERFEAWRNGPLAQIMRDFAAETEMTADDLFKDFSIRVAAVGNKALASFQEAFGCVSDDEIDAMDAWLKNAYMLHLVSSMNAVLPAGYPYAVTLVFSDPASLLRIAVIQRRIIPGIHDVRSRNIVPIFQIKNMPPGNITEIRRLTPIAVDYSRIGDSLATIREFS